MLDHIILSVTNFEEAKDFYLKALAPLGYTVIAEFPEDLAAGFGITDEKADFWIAQEESVDTTHIAFTATSKEAVGCFYTAALEAGGEGNGEPQYHTEYDNNYYGAYVFDPDGNNIEAVFRDPSVTT